MIDDSSLHNWLEAARSLDTASLSDAMDSLGLNAGLLGIIPQVTGAKCAGYAYTVLYQSLEVGQGFQNAANYIDDVPPGSVIAVSNAGRVDCTVWGDIMTQVASARQIAGTLIDGAARDIKIVRDLNYPLFSRAVFMQSGKNRVRLKGVQVSIAIAGVTIEPGDLLVADSNGCIAIPKSRVGEVVARAAAVEATEARIIETVKAGSRLADARRQHRYDEPWLHPKKKN